MCPLECREQHSHGGEVNALRRDKGQNQSGFRGETSAEARQGRTGEGDGETYPGKSCRVPGRSVCSCGAPSQNCICKHRDNSIGSGDYPQQKAARHRFTGSPHYGTSEPFAFCALPSLRLFMVRFACLLENTGSILLRPSPQVPRFGLRLRARGLPCNCESAFRRRFCLASGERPATGSTV